VRLGRLNSLVKWFPEYSNLTWFLSFPIWEVPTSLPPLSLEYYLYSLRFGWTLRRVGKTVFLISRDKTIEVSELSYDVLRFISRPRSLDDVTGFICNYIEMANYKRMKRDMKELLKFFAYVGAVRTN